MGILIEMIFSIFLSILLFGLALFLFKRNGNKISTYLGFVFLDTALWNFFTVLMVLVQNNDLKILFYSSKYIAISTFPVFTLLTILSFLKMDNLITKRNLTILFFIPFVSIILLYTNSYHNFFASELNVVNINGFTIVISHHNWAFFIHTVYVYLLFCICIFLLLMNWLNVAKLYRKQMSLIIEAILIPLATNFIYIYFYLSKVILDLTPLSFGFTLLLFLISVFRWNFTYIIPIARGGIFKNNITPIIVLDNDDRIIDMNISAEKIFHNDFNYFSGKNISELDIFIKKSVIPDDTTRVYLSSKIYKIKDSNIHGKDNLIIGKFKSFYDITNEEKYLNELKYLGFHDSLTSLYNRTYFNSIVDHIESEENLPLCIVLGDLNGLKTVNDTFGHNAGDEVIQLAAEILLKNIVTSDLVFRFGGDEFCILLQNTSELELKVILEHISSDFQSVDNYNTSIALGYTIKRSANESFNQLLSKADANMYIEKNRIKNMHKK